MIYDEEALFNKARDVFLFPNFYPTARYRRVQLENPDDVEEGRQPERRRDSGVGTIEERKEAVEGLSGRRDKDWTAEEVWHKWQSRDNRKGRHTLVAVSPHKPVHPSEASHIAIPPPSYHYTAIIRNISRMFTQCPYWDVSYLVAITFTAGSAIWVINSFFVWLPQVRPETKFEREETYGGGITALLGCLVFEFGAVLLMIEAFNTERSYCFGWAVEKAVDEEEKKGGLVGRLVSEVDELCTHHHRRLKLARLEKLTSSQQQDAQQSDPLSHWTWLPTYTHFRTVLLHDLGFLASLTEFLGATIFGISGFTILPGIHPHLSSHAANNSAYWAPQVIGGIGFCIASMLFMLETQTRWWKPALRSLGYWVGFWNLVGSVGFTLSGAIGMWPGSGGAYQAGCATFWGSWAFLVGSVLQWYESLEKYPVERGGREVQGGRKGEDGERGGGR